MHQSNITRFGLKSHCKIAENSCFIDILICVLFKWFQNWLVLFYYTYDLYMVKQLNNFEAISDLRQLTREVKQSQCSIFHM